MPAQAESEFGRVEIGTSRVTIYGYHALNIHNKGTVENVDNGTA